MDSDSSSETTEFDELARLIPASVLDTRYHYWSTSAIPYTSTIDQRDLFIIFAYQHQYISQDRTV